MKTVDFSETFAASDLKVSRSSHVCGTVSSMLSGLKTRSLGLNTVGTR